MKKITEGSRVIVSIYKWDIYIRSYKATVKGFTPGGLVKVDPDRYPGIKCVSADNVKVVSEPAG
ncbi:MAG: hypothetical protein JWP57_4281 [Spirosoma sp.]|nr:hypothetical protein [Spirosoma sp.]